MRDSRAAVFPPAKLLPAIGGATSPGPQQTAESGSLVPTRCSWTLDKQLWPSSGQRQHQPGSAPPEAASPGDEHKNSLPKRAF